MPYSILTYIGWPLLLVILIMMVYRGLHKEFPFFFTYLLIVIAVDAIRFTLFERRSAVPYFYTYWITEAIEILLGFVVLYEVFLIRLFPGFNITRIYRHLFPAMGSIILAMTAWMFFGAPARGPSKIVALIGALALALSFCQVAFLTFFGGLMLYMSREWGRHELGIAVGFGVYGAVKLCVTSERAQHFYAPIRIDQISTVAYLVAVVLWLFFLSKSDPEPEKIPITPEMVAEADRAYEDILHLLRLKPKRREES